MWNLSGAWKVHNGRIHASDPKGVDDIARLVSSQVKRLSQMEARQHVSEYKSRQTQEVA